MRFWWNRFGPMFAAEIRRRRVDRMRTCKHLDEVHVKINGVTHYLWRAVDHEGQVLESVVTKTRDRKAALKVLKKLIKPCQSASNIDQVTAFNIDQFGR